MKISLQPQTPVPLPQSPSLKVCPAISFLCAIVYSYLSTHMYATYTERRLPNFYTLEGAKWLEPNWMLVNCLKLHLPSNLHKQKYMHLSIKRSTAINYKPLKNENSQVHINNK